MSSPQDGLIALLRHGETEGGTRFRGSLDDPLTLAGWEQMRAAVGKEHWQRIVASPLKRCAEFAGELALCLGVPLEVDERLREIHFGTWEGKTAAELMESDGEALTRFWRDPAVYPPPGAEPLETFQARVLAAWRDLQRDHRGDRVLVVSHGGVIRTILCDVLGHPLERLLELELEIGHGTLRRVRLRGDAPAALLDEGEA